MAENELQATDAAEQAPTAPAEEVVKSIKGFSRDLTCMGFQFEIGKSYEAAGEIKACKNGFHAIEGHPLEVFDYYPPATSRYCETIQSGQLARHSDDSKIASAKITIGVEISISELTARAVKWVFDRAKWAGAPVATGDNEAATASGTRGAATASGDQGAATASGYQGAATASGSRGAATASGSRGAATASGDQGAATASGDQGAATASGSRGAATASGYQGAATASGDQGAATASGKTVVAIATGFEGKARGEPGSAICLVCRDDDGEIVAIRASKVGENGVAPGVWYSLDAEGNFVAVEDDE
jgi:hypothetical protein